MELCCFCRGKCGLFVGMASSVVFSIDWLPFSFLKKIMAGWSSRVLYTNADLRRACNDMAWHLWTVTRKIMPHGGGWEGSRGCLQPASLLGLAADAWSLGSAMQRSPAPQVLLQHVYSKQVPCVLGRTTLASRSAQTYYSLRPEI